MLKKSFASAVILCGCVAVPALAAPHAYFVINPSNTIPGTVALQLFADGEGLDWSSAQLIVELTQGTVFNIDPGDGGGDKPPTPFLIGFNPDLAFDTYVGTLDSDVPGPYPVGQGVNDFGPTDLRDLGFPALSLSGPLIAVYWADTFTGETGPTKIGNFTFTDDAQGTWKLVTGFDNNNLLVEQEGILIIPEPATLGFLGLAGSVLMRRQHATLRS